MDSNNNYFSAIDDKERLRNKKISSNKSSKKVLLLPNIKKNPSFASEKTASPLQIQIKNNNDLFKLPEFIHKQVRQYELHPYRQYNLKIINEDIKNKLFEMNKENNTSINLQNNNGLQNKKKESLTLSVTYKNFQENNQTKKNFMSDYKSTHLNLLRMEDTIKKIDKLENRDTKKICIEIPQHQETIKKKKKKNKTKFNASSKLIMKYRKLNRIKNLYDSNGDDESGEEFDEYVIDPETKFITILDSLIIVFFFILFCLNNIGSFNGAMLLSN